MSRKLQSWIVNREILSPATVKTVTPTAHRWFFPSCLSLESAGTSCSGLPSWPCFTEAGNTPPEIHGSSEGGCPRFFYCMKTIIAEHFRRCGCEATVPSGYCRTPTTHASPCCAPTCRFFNRRNLNKLKSRAVAPARWDARRRWHRSAAGKGRRAAPAAASFEVRDRIFWLPKAEWHYLSSRR